MEQTPPYLAHLARATALELIGIESGAEREAIILTALRVANNVRITTICPECHGVNFHRAECNGAREQQQKEKLGL